MLLLSKLIYRFKASQIKIPVGCFVAIDKLALKFIWRSKRPRIASSTLKKNEIKGLTLPNFKTYYNSTVIKTVYSVGERTDR